MTEHMTTRPQTPPKQTRHRRTRAELDALRTLARAAALGGESLASLRVRLQIPEATLTRWARLDGYRQIDIKTREEADAAARGAGADAIEAIREQAEELWELCEEMQDRPATGARRQVNLARARTLALAEAGHLDAAEEEIASVRRLARILAFGRAGTGEMEKFRNQAAVIVREKGLERAMAAMQRMIEEDEAKAAAREAAGLPPLPRQTLSPGQRKRSTPSTQTSVKNPAPATTGRNWWNSGGRSGKRRRCRRETLAPPAPMLRRRSA